MKTRAAVIAIAILLAGRAGRAGQAGQFASLQGRVVVWGTNEPIGKASIELRRADNVVYGATTNGDGVFVFASVPAGQYRVVATRPGYVNAEYGQRWPNGAGTPLTLPAGQAVSNVPIPMLRTGAINGTVRDALGNPLGNVEVQALKATYPSGRRVLASAQSVVTDDRGEYRLFWLTPGKYFVVAKHPDLTFSAIRAGGVSVGGGGVPGPNVRVPRYQSFRSGGDNAGASRVPFEAEKGIKEKYMPVYYPNTTDEAAAGVLDLAPGGEVRAIDFTVAPIRLHRIRGRIVSEASNEPAMSARVQWLTASGSAPDSAADINSAMGPRQGAVAVECCDGAFELNVPEGPATIVAAVENLTARVALNVGDGDIDGVVMAVGRRFNLKGRLTFEGRTPSAAELSALRLTLPIDPPVAGLLAGGYSSVLPDGSFTLPASRGDFMLSIQPLLSPPNGFFVPGPPAPAALSGAYVKSARLGEVDVLNTRVHLDADPQQTLEVVIGTATGAFEGRVLNRDRQPVPNVAVVVVPDAARRTRADLFKSTAADAAGRFRFDRLPPGDYLAFALDSAAADGEWQNPDYVASHERAGIPVKIVAGAAVMADLLALTE